MMYKKSISIINQYQLGEYTLVHTKYAGNAGYHILSLRQPEKSSALRLAIAGTLPNAIHKVFGEKLTIDELKNLTNGEINELVAWALLENPD